jgi:tRNA pseudouridine55 synthase
VSDGALIIDKPPGLTSHDVVAAARRILRERRIGHAGTLDPLATGVLVLLSGKATRLARFASASEKTYDATVLFGLTTDTYDVSGTVTSRSTETVAADAVMAAAASLTGTYLQEPPAYSAKQVGGQRAYELARRNQPVELRPVPVTVSALTVTTVADQRAVITLTCSAGFYVRSFAHTLGQRVGPGACLESLRRTRSGAFGLDEAIGLDALQAADRPESALLPVTRVVAWMPERMVTAEGRERVAHGRELRETHLVAGGPAAGASPPSDGPSRGGWVRVSDDSGELIAVATAGRDGALHPSVVLI